MRAAAALLICLHLPLGRADDVRSAITAGNADYDAGRYNEALEKYVAAGEPADRATEANLLHNRAAAHFKLGELAEARELWIRAATLTDAPFEAACAYNLGNCDYADALKAAESGDATASIAALKKATARYRDALRLDPTLANARANLELAAALRTQLEQAPTSQPDSQSAASQKGQPDQNSSQPSQDQPPDPDQKGEEEQQDGQSSTQPDGERQQEPSSQPDSGEPPPQPSDQPSSSDDQNQNQSNDNSSDPSSDTQNQNQQNDNTQPKPQGEPDNSNTANDNGQAASPASADNANDNQSSNDNSPPQPQPVATQPSEGAKSDRPQNSLLNMTREEAERLLQKVRDMEKARRQALLQRERTRHKPVDRDW